MVEFEGEQQTIQSVYDSGNGHVFQSWGQLNIDQKKSLIKQLKSINFELLDQLFKETDADVKKCFHPAKVLSIPKTDLEKDHSKNACDMGVELIQSGKLAAFIVAGGQGTRLGFDGPKGAFSVGAVSGKSLFQLHAEKIIATSNKYNVSIPWLVMTSEENHRDTLDFFEKNHFFGLDKEQVIFFKQHMIPSLDEAGKLILKSPYEISMNPDGHGGSLAALNDSGALSELKSRGIELVSYFQVDNPLVNIIDPTFIGFHLMNSAEVSNKAVRKVNASEKVGVFVEYEDGASGIVEYSDLSESETTEVDGNGDLQYGMGNIAIHLFNIDFIERIVSEGGVSLPYHKANKSIKAWVDGEVVEVPGIKYEKFIFDSLSLTQKSITLEVNRSEEFAPVKNKSGSDSVETSMKMMTALFRQWLNDVGVHIPDEIDQIEISSLYALSSDDLSAEIVLPATPKVYLG